MCGCLFRSVVAFPLDTHPLPACLPTLAPKPHSSFACSFSIARTSLCKPPMLYTKSMPECSTAYAHEFCPRSPLSLFCRSTSSAPIAICNLIALRLAMHGPRHAISCKAVSHSSTFDRGCLHESLYTCRLCRSRLVRGDQWPPAENNVRTTTGTLEPPQFAMTV